MGLGGFWGFWCFGDVGVLGFWGFWVCGVGVWGLGRTASGIFAVGHICRQVTGRIDQLSVSDLPAAWEQPPINPQQGHFLGSATSCTD